MLVEKYYEDLNTLHVNTMPNRAYYIPNDKRQDKVLEQREISSRFQSLNGMWKFRYFESIYELKDPFYEVDASQMKEIEGFESVSVPGMWQMYGYDQHQYTNVRYPFPCDPPFVPRENPCGAYLTSFMYQKQVEAPCVHLNFEGVDSCFYVWVNGEFAGYSQVSHATSEFDITRLVVEGENTLAVLVLKWCDGSYLEDQDKFRMSGIFRDVYLLHRSKNGIYDYFVKAIPTNDYTSADVSINYVGSKETMPTLVRYQLLDQEGKIVAQGIENHGEITFTLSAICLWSAEIPYLYTLVLETEYETIVDYIGIRDICTQDGKVLINGVPIKFHGVNRHDSDPVTGYVISDTQLLKDLQLMKEHNVNAIRTSHYPNAPHHYYYYDKYGFYIIDEADNESHGTDKVFKEVDDWDTHKNFWNVRIADNPEYIESTIDRTRRCVERDKNRPSVIIWSMGNECAYGCTFEAALKWTKQFDSTRLTHYEGARYVPETKQYDYSNIDLYSRMYPDMEEIHKYCTEDGRKPYLMCEYAHAMGNSQGDLEDYFKVIHQYDCMCGGFIWEWCDHAVYDGVHSNGKERYLYGGDFYEYPHDGNFCVDGLVTPDRKPHTGLLEFKHVYRPARVVEVDEEHKTMTIRNYMDFMNLQDYITVTYAVVVDGEVIDTYYMKEVDIAPHTSRCFNITLPEKIQGKGMLRVEYHLKKEQDMRHVGFLVGREEYRLTGSRDGNQQVRKWENEDHNISEESKTKFQVASEEKYIFISGETSQGQSFTYSYNKHTGMFETIVINGVAQIEKPMEFNIWRAPTDNDRRIKQEWMRAGYDRMIVRTFDTAEVISNNEARLSTDLAITAPFIQRIINLTVTWTIQANGVIHMAIEGEKEKVFPFLPRFGVRLFLPKAYQKVEYCGLGPVENYVDKHYASYHGIFKGEVNDFYEDYIKPQEHGNRHDCDYIILRSPKNQLKVYNKNTFDCSISMYTQEELTRKAHNFELEEAPHTVLCVDWAQSGIGSNSCGPSLLPQYQYNPEKIREEFVFRFY